MEEENENGFKIHKKRDTSFNNSKEKSGFAGKPKFERNNRGGGNARGGGNNRNSFGGGGGDKPQYTPRDGDWKCEDCGKDNFARNKECFRCQKPAPPGTGGKSFTPREGDWECDDCGNNNFSWRGECHKCQKARPGGVPAGSGRKSFGAGGGRGGRGGTRGGGRGGNRGGFNKSFDSHSGGQANKKIKFD